LFDFEGEEDMKKALILFAVAVSAGAHAQAAFFTSHLDTSDPLWTRNTTNMNYYYEVVPFWVATSGNYTIEMSSVPQHGAFDTYLFVYQNQFNPASWNSNLVGFNDDYSGALTVLPGPFAGAGVTGTGTGAGGAQPTSRVVVNLQAGVQYWSVQTSWSSFATGQYFVGIGDGPGSANLGLVPEPATMAALGLGLAVLARRRRNRK
jgi:hypothetical protein